MAPELERVYTCPTFLTQAGYDLTALSTTARWQVCHRLAALVDQWTNQWFNGEPGPYYLDGRDSPLIEHKTRIKLLSVTEVTILSERTHQRRQSIGVYNPPLPYDVPLQPTEWVRRDRALARVRGEFPGGEQNIQLQGVLGWVDHFKTVETTSTAALTAAATSLTVTDASQFSVRDVVDVVGVDDGVRVIVTGVNRGTNTISFDAPGFLSATIPSGAVVRTYGKVPLPIETVTNYLYGFTARQAGSDGNMPIDESRLKRERTDDYEYELFDPGAVGAIGSVATGNRYYDNILRNFSAPGGVKVIGG